MGIIERLQRVDERLGLDSPQARIERQERRAALDSLPPAMQRSLTRRRWATIALIVATVVATGLLLLSFLPAEHDAWIVVTITLTFIGTIVGGIVGRRIESNLLAKHREGPSGEE